MPSEGVVSVLGLSGVVVVSFVYVRVWVVFAVVESVFGAIGLGVGGQLVVG